MNDDHIGNVGTSQGEACAKKKPPSQKEKQSDSSSEENEENIEGIAKRSESVKQ